MIRGDQAGRIALVCTVFLILILGTSACKDQDRAGKGAGTSAAGPVLGEDAAAEEEDLLRRRDALLGTRLELRTKRADLAEKRQEVSAKGGDTSELDRETEELLNQESDLVDQERELNSRLDTILSDRRAMITALAGGGGEAGGTAGREASLASREKDLARREQRLAEREAALSSREEGLAAKWKDSCAAGTTTTIVQTVDPRGVKYSRRDVAPLLSKARAEMQKKGILKIDLPATARDLESEATGAMAKGDFGQARFAASQLYATVRGMDINKPFIAAKIGRLNGIIQGKTVSGQVEQLFRQATEDVADGKFSAANRKLNKIYGQIN
jgi:hypothetical protein